MNDLFVSPYVKVGGMFWFARMLRKIRLHAEGRLPADYQPNLGVDFDGRCVRFLGLGYAALRERTLAGGSDEEIFAWCHEHGRKPTEEEVLIWNEFMSKRGWRDRYRSSAGSDQGVQGKVRPRASHGHPDLLRFLRGR